MVFIISHHSLDGGFSFSRPNPHTHTRNHHTTDCTSTDYTPTDNTLTTTHQRTTHQPTTHDPTAREPTTHQPITHQSILRQPTSRRLQLIHPMRPKRPPLHPQWAARQPYGGKPRAKVRGNFIFPRRSSTRCAPNGRHCTHSGPHGSHMGRNLEPK